MWKFKELRLIERYGFPDGDFAVFEETKKGKKTGNEITTPAYIHNTSGSDFMHAMGANSPVDYLKLKGRKVTINRDIDETDEFSAVIKITMKGIDGQPHVFTFFIDENEEDWDTDYAKACSTSI